VGVRNEEKEAKYPPHYLRFNVDEDALLIAVAVLTRAAMEFRK
jgi:amidohydrolase